MPDETPDRPADQPDADDVAVPAETPAGDDVAAMPQADATDTAGDVAASATEAQADGDTAPLSAVPEASDADVELAQASDEPLAAGEAVAPDDPEGTDDTVAPDEEPDDTTVAEEAAATDAVVTPETTAETPVAPFDDADTDTPVPAAAPDDVLPVLEEPSAELRAVVEALVFASPEPMTPKMLYKLLANESKEAVSAALNDLRADYVNRPGLQMVEVAGGYQIVTRPELHEWVRRLFHERSTQKLSVAALESLAVIAYRQPVTALEVTEIRGVNASGVLSTLLERNLIKIVGRKNVVGRPFMYGTTKEFLIRFGLKDLHDLPRIEDMADALGFDPPAGLIEQTPKDEFLPLEEHDVPPTVSGDFSEGAPPVDAPESGDAAADDSASGDRSVG